MPDARRLERIAGAVSSYFNSLLVWNPLCRNGRGLYFSCLMTSPTGSGPRRQPVFRKRRGIPSQQVVTYAFGDKHCFRNYPLQEMAV